MLSFFFYCTTAATILFAPFFFFDSGHSCVSFMPGLNLLSKIISGMDQTWPENATLFFQDEATEISLPDFASSLGVRTLLQMCGLRHTVDRRCNAEFMSPNGQVPFLLLDRMILEGFEEINSHIELKKHCLSEHLDEAGHAEMAAHMAMVESVLGNAEKYIAWNDDLVSDKVTKQRYGEPYPWPLNVILPHFKQKRMQKILSANQWQQLSEDQVCEKVRKCCTALSVKLGSNKYFFGDRPTALDALVFGHLFALVTTVLPNNCLEIVIKDFENLQNFLRRVNESYYSNVIASPKISIK